MDADEILHIQRALRSRLFEGPSAVRWRPGRELAAQLLLYLDDPAACWRLTTDWLRDALDADRVDGGFGGFVLADRCHDYVAEAESQRPSLGLPEVVGRRFEASNPALQSVWRAPQLLAIGDVSQHRMPAEMRGRLKSLGTAAKIALPVRDGERLIGLLCADWHCEVPRWNTEVCLEVAGFAHNALGAVIGAAQQIGRGRSAQRVGTSTASQDTSCAVVDADVWAMPVGWSELTPAEVRVARLVARGLSYKEVARLLERSLSTIDHQLRSIRTKRGVASTSRLVRLLSEELVTAGPRAG